MRRKILYATLRVTALLSLVWVGLAQSERHEPIVPQLTTTPTLSVSTVPSNGDLHPYGVAFVPHGFAAGKLNPGDLIVSNFNDSANVQGTGTTIVSISPSGQQSLFFFQLVGFTQQQKSRLYRREVTISLHLTDICKTIAFPET